MNQQIRKVTEYIHEHLDERLDLAQLAKIAGYSHFHFSRVFKLHMGESVMSYRARLRILRASTELITGNKSMINIALDSGFDTPTGFLKAFKKRFGTTPSAYKRSAKILPKIYKDSHMNAVEIVLREESFVVFTRELGDYTSSSERAWKRLSASMEDLRSQFEKNPPKKEVLLGQGNAEAIGICHDDPQAELEENLRYDAALAWTKEEVDVLCDYGFESKSIVGGKYAKILYRGDFKEAEKAWYGIYTWIGENGYAPRDEPAFEKYLNGLYEEDASKILTEVYVPIQ